MSQNHDSASPVMTALPSPALIVLIGPSAAGKSTWAAANFRPGEVVSSDDFRALCGSGPDDQTAGTEAFALLDQIVQTRLSKRLTTVVDTLGLDDRRRLGYLDAARRAGMACVAVGFDTDAALCHERNRARSRPLPKATLDRQIRQWRVLRERIADEGFDRVLIDGGAVYQVAAALAEPGAGSTSAGRARAEGGRRCSDGLQFDLVLSRYTVDEGRFASTLTDIATVAERVGFRSLLVMDHFRQIPQVGRPWEPMLEPYTTLAYLAATTSTLRLGTLVTGVELRNVGLLAKILATLDVLSGGRAECGLGAGWFDAEQVAFGYPVHSDRIRLDTLEDALQALPVLWGPGAKSFSGKVVSIPEALAYPRPIQDPLPILVGGGGEKRTLRLAAAYGHACNVLGTDPATVARKIDVVRRHCHDLGRDPTTLAVTTLNPVVHASSGAALDTLVESLRPSNQSWGAFAAANHAATTAEHVVRFRQLGELGVDRVCVSLTGPCRPEAVEDFGSVMDALG